MSVFGYRSVCLFAVGMFLLGPDAGPCQFGREWGWWFYSPFSVTMSPGRMFSMQSLGAWAVAGALFYATMPKKAKEMSTKEIENKNQQTLAAQKKGLQKD